MNKRDEREGRAKNSHKKGRQLCRAAAPRRRSPLAVGLQPALTGGRRRRRQAAAVFYCKEAKGDDLSLVSEAPRGCFHAHFDDVGNQLELVSKELNHLVAILHVYAGDLIFYKVKKMYVLVFFKEKREILLHY